MRTTLPKTSLWPAAMAACAAAIALVSVHPLAARDEPALKDLVPKGMLIGGEAALLKRVRDATFEFISVDDFDAADLAAGRRSKPTLRSVA